MKTSPPKISVNMPVYNGEQFLEEAIDSILDQTFNDFEFLIINDGSTDKSKEIIKSYSDPRIRYFENKKNLGITATRNIGLAQAQGEYLAIIDCDDFAYPNRFEEQVEFLDQNTDISMVACWAEIEMLNEQGDVVHVVWRTNAPNHKIPSLLLFSNFFIQSTIMLRKFDIPVGGYRDFDPAEDYDLWTRLTAHRAAYLIRKPLVRYRVHGNNVSNMENTKQEMQCERVLRYQLEKLGLRPEAEELKFHRKIGLLNTQFKLSSLRRAETWMMNIIAANEVTNIFDTKALMEVVADIWFSICIKSSGNSNQACLIYSRSPLSKGNRRRFSFTWLRWIEIWGKWILTKTRKWLARSNFLRSCYYRLKSWEFQ